MREPQLERNGPWAEVESEAEPPEPIDWEPEDGATYRLLVEQSADVLFHTLDDVVTMVSPSLDTLLGYTPDELVGSTMSHLWHPVDLPDVIRLNDRIHSGAAGVIRGRLRHRDGHYVDVQLAMRPVPEPDGRHQAVGSITDVGALVDSERLLQDSEASFRLLAEQAADVVFRGSNEGIVEWISPSVREVTGWRPEEMVGLPIRTFVHPEDLDAFTRLQVAIGRGDRGVLEVRIRCADDTYRWVSTAVRPLLDASGAVVGRAGGWRVVDAEHAARQSLEEAERRFRLVLHHAPIAMCLTDPTGRFVMVNPAFSDLLACSAEQLLDSSWQEFTHPDDLEADVELVAEMLEGRRNDYQHRKRFIDANGNVVWGDLSVAALRDDFGAVANFVGQVTDVTELVAARNELEISEAHYRLIAEHSSDLVLRCGPDRSIEWASPSAHSFGWSPEELIGRHVGDLVHPADRTSSSASRAWLFATNQSIDPSAHFRVRLRTGSGDLRWVDGTASAIVDDEGQPVAIVSGLRDVDDLVVARDDTELERLRLAVILDALADPHVLLGVVRDETGEVVDLVVERWNRAATEFLGDRSTLTRGVSVDDLPLGAGRAEVVAACRTAAETHRTVRADALHVPGSSASDTDRRVDVRATSIDGSVILTWADVTARVTAEERLRRSEDRLRTVVEVAPVGTALLDADMRIEAPNSSLCDLLDAEPAWLVGRRLVDIEVDQGLEDGLPATPGEIRLRRTDGSEVWVERSIAPVVDPTGGDSDRPGSYVVQYVDVERARRRREHLEHEAAHDSLTGLANRRELDRRLERMLAHPGRRSTVLGVLAIDVDHLKPVNDELGHPVGDDLLRQTAVRLEQTLRDDDTVARTSGDEFVAVLPGQADLTTALLVADKVLAAFTPEMELGGGRRHVTVSIGVTVAEPGETPSVVLARADQALLRAKAGGRAQVASISAPTSAG